LDRKVFGNFSIRINYGLMSIAQNLSPQQAEASNGDNDDDDNEQISSPRCSETNHSEASPQGFFL
jgi:hypothetical protein